MDYSEHGDPVPDGRRALPLRMCDSARFRSPSRNRRACRSTVRSGGVRRSSRREPPRHAGLCHALAFVRICALAARDTDNEAGGALIGAWRLDTERDCAFIVVEAALPAEAYPAGQRLPDLHAGYARRPQRTNKRRAYPEKRIVGCFHTHPRMGVFLSDYDTWLHRHFFPDPGSGARSSSRIRKPADSSCATPTADRSTPHYSPASGSSRGRGKSWCTGRISRAVPSEDGRKGDAMNRTLRAYYYAILGAIGGLFGWQISNLAGLSFHRQACI